MIKNSFIRFLTITLLGILFLLPAGTAAADIFLANPGFDEDSDPYTKPPTGWQFSAGIPAWVTIGSNNYLSLGVPQYNNSPFTSAKIGIHNSYEYKEAYLWQSFLATPFTQYEASAYLKSITGIPPAFEYLTKGFALRQGAKAWGSLRWFDGSDNSLDTEDSAFLDGISNSWQQFSVTDEAPANTAYGAVLLRVSSPPMYGYTRVAYFDDVSVRVTPEPASIFLFGIGGAGMALIKRKRKA